MYFSSLFAARTGSAMAQGFSQTQLTRAQGALAHRVNPIGLTLALALRDDCCFFAALSAFAVMLLHGLLCRQQSRLEDDGGRKRRQQRERHQLAHARCTRVM
jgi:hypothetical protein